MLNRSVHALISVGSNLASRFGSPSQTVQRAINDLAALSVAPVLVSSLWRTAPVDATPESADYINALCAIEPNCDQSSIELLQDLLNLEAHYERCRSGIPNEPRSLDMDLIACREECVTSKELILPHPRAHMRRFVLAPLSELDPSYTLPGHSVTAFQLLTAINPVEQPIERFFGTSTTN